MRILFWGTPSFALPTLAALEGEGHQVVGVVTQPDRPKGRGRKTRPSPVKEFADVEGYDVLTPERPRGEAFLAEIRSLEPEVSVVVAYGHILNREVLDVPSVGSFNIHASLLPQLRGAAPINWALVRGHEETGVTIIRMVEAMDAGPILAQERFRIGPEDSVRSLSPRLAELGAVAMLETLTMLEAGTAVETEQDHDDATFAPKVDRETARIDWDQDAPAVCDFIRGMDDVPGAWSTFDGQPVKLFSPVVSDGGEVGEPGEVVVAGGNTDMVVATALGEVAIGEVQPPGKRRMAASEWVRGRGPGVGDRFA